MSAVGGTCLIAAIEGDAGANSLVAAHWSVFIAGKAGPVLSEKLTGRVALISSINLNALVKALMSGGSANGSICASVETAQTPVLGTLSSLLQIAPQPVALQPGSHVSQEGIGHPCYDPDYGILI